MSQPTLLALSRLTGRPVARTSAVAMPDSAPVLAAAPGETPRVPAGMERIIRPQAAVRWILPQLSAVTPQYIESTLRGAFAGGHLQQWELFDLMEDTWPRLAKNLNEIKRAVVSMDWKIEPWAEEDTPPSDSAEERAKLVSSALWRMNPDPAADENGFESTLYDILDAHAKGLSVLELHWEIRNAGQLGDITAPRATAWVHPANYAWSNEGRLGLRVPMLGGDRSPSMALQTTSGMPGRDELMDFPPDKFLIAISKAKTGSAMNSALLRSLAWWWCAANFSSDWLMNLAQIFGLPFRWANYATGSSQQTINAISGMLENMGSAGWAAFPEGTTLELKEAGNLGSMSPQGDLLDRADKNCDLLILGQTLTSDTGGMGQGSGSMALGKVHAGVRGEIIDAAANFAAEVINRQLVPAILRLNYGDDQECPEFCPEEKKIADTKANAERDNVLLAAGVEMPKKWFYKRHDIPLPQEGEETISKPEPAPGGFGAGERFQGAGSNGNQPATSNLPPETEDEDTEAEDDGETEDEKESGPMKAARGKPAARGNASLSRLASAFAEDLQPLRERLARIVQIEDETILRAKLTAFVESLPKLLADINADPESARALEDEMRAGLIQIAKRKS